jgi:D-serine deaminase-like pyridoxal phosphate-dependent protein
MKDIIGQDKQAIDTPALLVDRDKLQRNIDKMAEFFRDKPCNVRPMWKTPKTVEIAKLQLEAGAIGITCAKVSEAALLVEAGVQDILIANEVVGGPKAAKLAELNYTNDVKCAVDDPVQVAALSRAASGAGVTIGVVVDVFVGLPRCGVKPEDAPALAKIVHQAPGLKLRGVMGYEGHVVNMEDEVQRRAEAERSMSALTRAAALIRADGLPCEIVSGGGTGTYNFTGTFPGVTEVQAGSYCLMDTKYDKVHLGFEKAVTVLATVWSRSPALSGWTIIDAGMKTMSHEFGLPELIGVPHTRLAMLSEEHGHLFCDAGDAGLAIGRKVELYPSHICTTVNLHDRMYVIQNDKVVDVWRVRGRGQSQ